MKVGFFAIIFDNQAHRRVAETQTSPTTPTFMVFHGRIISNRENRPDSTPPGASSIFPYKIVNFHDTEKLTG